MTTVKIAYIQPTSLLACSLQPALSKVKIACRKNMCHKTSKEKSYRTSYYLTLPPLSLPRAPPQHPHTKTYRQTQTLSLRLTNTE